MEIRCDTEKMKAISKDIDVQISRYNEILDKFYGITKNFHLNGWSGKASNNYSKYIDEHKKDYDKLASSLVSFSDALKGDIYEIEYAINSSKVKSDD